MGEVAGGLRGKIALESAPPDAANPHHSPPTTRHSVPRVFVGGKFIGGGDDTAAKAANGMLQQLLADAGVL